MGKTSGGTEWPKSSCVKKKNNTNTKRKRRAGVSRPTEKVHEFFFNLQVHSRL